MKIFHIGGTWYSGKSTLINKVITTEDIVKWSIKEDFYIANWICDSKGKNFDWDAYHEEIKNLSDLIKDFLSFAAQKQIVLFESSGTNKTLNKILDLYNPISLILKSPSIEELVIRAEKEDQNAQHVLNFNEMFSKSFPITEMLLSAKQIEEIINNFKVK